jgi:pre-mRNA-splicing helicase BRR2
MELLSSASEFDDLAVRRKESGELQLLSDHMPHKLEKPAFNDPHVKTNLLLQAHLSRISLKEDLAKDQMVIVQKSLPLLYAMVDVIAANSWLKVALSCMELCQGIVQGSWATDSQLLQLPHISKQCAQRCKDAGVSSIYDLLDLDDAPRNSLLGLSEAQMADIAGELMSAASAGVQVNFCLRNGFTHVSAAVANRYPAIDLNLTCSAEEVQVGVSLACNPVSLA